MSLRDREDTSRQEQAVHDARATFSERLYDLALIAQANRADDVAAEARAVVKRLASKAKRPPAVDTTDLLGALSAARRHHDDYPPEYDDAERLMRDAERALDTAVYDLATARGADG